MENKHNNYLDKVVEFLVRDTKIDFKGKEIFLPFLSIPTLPLLPSISYPTSYFSLSPPPLLPSFSKYCKVTYGLTDEEIEYVWKEYTDIIKDIVENER